MQITLPGFSCTVTDTNGQFHTLAASLQADLVPDLLTSQVKIAVALSTSNGATLHFEWDTLQATAFSQCLSALSTYANGLNKPLLSNAG